MQKWEYKYVYSVKTNEIVQHPSWLSELGSAGWELVTVVPEEWSRSYSFFFKRPVQE